MPLTSALAWTLVNLTATPTAHGQSDGITELRRLSQAQGWVQLGKPELALPLLTALPDVPQTLPVRAWTWVLTGHASEAFAALAPFDSLRGELLYLRGLSQLHHSSGPESTADLLMLLWTEPDSVWGQAALWQLAEADGARAGANILGFDAAERALIRRHLPSPPTAPTTESGDALPRLDALWHAAPAQKSLAAQVRHALGVTELHRRHTDAALRWLRPLANGAPPGLFTTAVHFSLGQAYSAAGQAEVALNHLTAARQGSGKLATEALAQAGELAARLQRYPEAREALQALLVANPVGPARARALWGLGWVAYRAGQPTEARTFFSTLRREDPYGPWAPGASYWEGRALEALGDAQAARQRWVALRQSAPTDYYAYRAELLLGPEPWPNAPSSGPHRSDAVQSIDALLSAGMQRRARQALQTALQRQQHWDPHTLQALAQAAQRAESPSLASAFEAARCERFGGDDPQCLTQLAASLSTRHWGTLQAAAVANRLDPALVLSVARVESNFVPQARSPAGALGLMQLMPATAKSLWHEEHHRAPRRVELLDPAVNVRLGTRFLARLLRSFGRREEYALATYNAGGAAVTRWRTMQGDLPADVFVEEIPFSQTREYVKKVLGWRQLARVLRLAESVPVR